MWPFKKKRPSRKTATHAAPDLDKPVENPQLSEALAGHASMPSDETWRELLIQVSRANYLVAVLDDETNIELDQQPDTTVIKKGSRLAILFCQNDQGQKLATLFTDREQIQAWTDQRVSTLVMPAEQAWEFVASQSMYDGVVINPAGWPLELDRRQIGLLQQAEGATPAGAPAAVPVDDVVQNDLLVDLLQRVQSDQELRVDIYEALAQSNLVLGSREPLPSAEQETAEEVEITLLTTVSPAGGPALPVFTDGAQLQARNSEAYPIGLPAARVFSLVLEDGYDGIVLNPASNWIFIPREDIESMFVHA